MWFLTLLFLFGCLTNSSQYRLFDGLGSTNSVEENSCNVTHLDYQLAQFKFHFDFYRNMVTRGYVHFINSPLSTWLLLSAMAEGADPDAQQELFKFLELPDDVCIRKKYYEITTDRIAPGNDVHIKNKRMLMIDESVQLNPSWYETVLRYDLLHVLTAPLHYNPVEAVGEINWLLSSSAASLNLNGNSVLLDSFDYNALWTTAFEDADVIRSPFYNNQGEKIGSVDLMRVKKRARVGYFHTLQGKALEMPVGVDGRYRIVIAVYLDKPNISETYLNVTVEHLIDVFNSVKDSYEPIEIGIPRMILSSQLDMRSILEDFGVTKLWSDPAATRHISTPAALPSSYLQRTTITLNTHGVSPTTAEYPTNTSTEVPPVDSSPDVMEFLANRPFVFGLFDKDWSTLLISGCYSVPTYRN